MTVHNDLLVHPLHTYHIIWDGVQWSGGSATGNAPGSGDGALDLLVETGQADPLPANATVRNLVILDSGTLDLSDKNLTITGNAFGSVGGRVTGSGKVILGGTSAQEITGPATWQNIEIDNGSGVTITDGQQDVTGVLFPENGQITTNDLLRMKATDSSYSQIAPGSGSFDGQVTYEMYVDQAGWHNICAPLENVTLAELEDDIDLYYSGDPAGQRNVFSWNPRNASWLSADNNTASLSDSGYTVYIDNNFVPAGGGVNEDGQLPVTLDVTGGVLTGTSASPTIDWSDSTAGSPGFANANPSGNDGWNLIPNPFASNIIWDDVVTRIDATSDIHAYYYVWNSNTGQYEYSNGTSTSPNLSGLHSISPLQAFFVKLDDQSAIGDAETVFQFDANDRSVETNRKAPFFRPAGYREYVYFSVSDNDNRKDLATVVFDEENEEDYERMHDAFQFRSPQSESPSLFTYSADSMALSYNFWSELGQFDTLRAGFTGVHDRDYSIRIDSLTGGNIKVYLKDLKENISYDMDNGSYYFTGDTSYTDDRFLLIFEREDFSTAAADSNLPYRFWVEDKTARFDFSGYGRDEKAELKVYDLSGRLLYSDDKLRTNGRYQFRLPVRERLGIYIYKLETSNNEQYEAKFLY